MCVSWRHPVLRVAGLALLPLVLVVGVNALFTYLVFPALDLSFMAERFASLDPSRLTGLWALLIALLVACTTLVQFGGVQVVFAHGLALGDDFQQWRFAERIKFHVCRAGNLFQNLPCLAGDFLNHREVLTKHFYRDVGARAFKARAPA